MDIRIVNFQQDEFIGRIQATFCVEGKCHVKLCISGESPESEWMVVPCDCKNFFANSLPWRIMKDVREFLEAGDGRTRSGWQEGVIWRPGRRA